LILDFSDIMPEIKISEESKSLIKTAGGSIIKQADGTLGDIISLVSKGEKLVSHIENIVGMFKDREGAGSSVIQSKEPAPPVTTNNKQAPQESPKAPGVATQKIDDKQQFQQLLSTPEGRKLIHNGLSELINYVGEDATLKDLKQSLEFIDRNKPKKKEDKK